MASRTRKHIRPQSPMQEACLESVVLMGHKLETMNIDGIIYIPCRICNRLFRDEKLAIGHLQKCKPRIYLIPDAKISNESTENECRDPYEIIPEEMDLEDGIVLNNNTDRERNCSGYGKWTKKFRRFYNNNDIGSYTEAKCNNLDTLSNKPKKNGVSPDSSTDLKHLDIDEDNKTSLSPELDKRQKPEAAIRERTPKKKRSTSNRTSNRGLTDQQIEERLKRISERLKKHKPVDLRNEDEEEEERRAVEERLSSLNKESEVRFLDEDDLDERLNDEDDSSKDGIAENSDNKEQADVISQSGEGIGIQDSLVQQCLLKMQKSAEEFSNGHFSDERSSKTGTGFGDMMVITQRPDGQLHGCGKCSEVFVNPMDLLRHTRIKHTYPRIVMAPSEVKKFFNAKDRSYCPICEKPMASTHKSIYIKHLQTHSCVSEYECPVCKKKFRRQDHMRAHRKRHII